MNELRSIFLWCVILNYGVLILWFFAFILAHDWIYRMHTRWFKLSPETFDAMHYVGMSIYKIGILLLVLVPLIAIYIVY